MRIFFSFLLLLGVQLAVAQCPKDFEDTFILPAIKNQDNDPALALEIIEEGMKLLNGNYKECKYPLSTLHIIRGAIYRNKGDYLEAHLNLDTALEIRSKLQDTIGVSSVFSVKSSVHLKQGNYEKAIIAVDQAIYTLEKTKEIAHPKDFYKKLGRYYINKANILIEIDSLNQAYDNLRRSKEIFEKGELDDEGVVIADYNLALTLIKKEEFDKAEQLLLDCKQYYEQKENIVSIAQVHDGLGWLSYFKGEYQIAENYFEKSIQFYQKLGDSQQQGLNISRLSLAYNYLAQDKNKEAIKVANEVKFDVEDNPYDLVRLENLYIKIYKEMGQQDSLLAHLSNLEIINQRIFPNFSELGLSVAMVELREMIEKKKMRQKLIRNGLVIGLLLIVLLLMALGFHLLLKKAERKQLEAENTTQENKFQEKISKIYRSFSNEFHKIRMEVDGRLHDEVCPRIISVKREIEYFQAVQKKETLGNAITLADSAYEAAKALISGKKYFPEEKDWLQLLRLLINEYKKIGQYEVSHHINLNENDLNHQIGREICIITNVLLENIEKHAQAKKANVDLFKQNGSILLIIEDDGIGFFSHKKPGKIQRDSKGIGLKNVEQRVKKHLKGNMRIDSQLQKGTAITIEIPT